MTTGLSPTSAIAGNIMNFILLRLYGPLFESYVVNGSCFSQKLVFATAREGLKKRGKNGPYNFNQLIIINLCLLNNYATVILYGTELGSLNFWPLQSSTHCSGCVQFSVGSSHSIPLVSLAFRFWMEHPQEISCQCPQSHAKMPLPL